MLRLAQGIGVEVVSVSDDPGSGVLEVLLGYAGRVPDAPVAGAVAASIGAKVAAQLADLHALGLAHGAVELEHVLVDAAGAVRLCGFGDCAPGDGAPDVHALADLLDALVAPGDRSAEAAAVRAAAVRARGEETPTAAAMAASLASAGSAPRVDARPVVASTRSSRRWPVAVVAGVIAACIAAVVAVALPSGTGATVAAVTTTTSPPSTTSTTTTTAVVGERVWPSAPPTVAGDGATWRFGDAGDDARMGAWWCADAMPALVRGDGSVWVVRDWAAGPVYVATIEDEIVDVTVERDADGCDDLVVTTASGPVRPLA